MRITKRILAVLMIAVMAFMLSACEKNPATDILGKWDMDSDFVRNMLRLNDDIISKTQQSTGKSDIGGTLEFLANGTMILDIRYPSKVDRKVEGQSDPVTEYIYNEVHEEYPFEFKDGKLYINNRIVNYRITGNVLALNGNSRTLVVSKAK